MTNRYEASDRLSDIASDMELGGYKNWPREIREVAEQIRTMENKLWAIEVNTARIEQINAELLAVLKASLSTLERLAVEEARRNRAPTGLPPKTAAQELYENARTAIAKAES